MKKTSPSEYYTFYEVIGSGASSTVYKAENKSTKFPVAIKVIPKSQITKQNQINAVQNELHISRLVDHPHIIHFYDAFEDPKYIYFVLENAEGGEVGRSLSGGPFTEKKARHVFQQLVSGVDYLHSELNVLHRDLKLENIVIDRYDNIRIVDFGLSTFFDLKNSFSTDVVGSPSYAAPEMVLRQPYSSPLDIWCLGVILFTMVCGYYPFSASNSSDLASKIAYSSPNYPHTLSDGLRNLLEHLLSKNPLERYTIKQIKDDPWCKYFEPNVSSLKFSVGNELDSQVLETMHDLSIHCNDLISPNDLKAISREVAVYKILRTSTITQLIPSIITISRNKNKSTLSIHLSGPIPAVPNVWDGQNKKKFREKKLDSVPNCQMKCEIFDFSTSIMKEKNAIMAVA